MTDVKRLVMVMSIAALACLGACAAEKAGPSQADAGVPNAGRAHELAQEAQELHRKGKIDEAIRAYARSVEAYRGYSASWYNMGVLLMQTGKNVDAAAALYTAAETDLADPRPHTALGLLAQDLLHYDEAARFYTQALDRDPNYLPALRKSIEVDQLRDTYTDETVQRIRRALLRETDETWKGFLQRQKFKAEAKQNAATPGF